jgi:hypothetical protein
MRRMGIPASRLTKKTGTVEYAVSIFHFIFFNGAEKHAETAKKQRIRAGKS